MTAVDLFQANRSALFGVAYRMLGSATDAEDVVQDAWLRFSSARPGDLRSAKSYLTTIVTRLCLDRLKSARTTREEYIGPWLPEPVVTDDRREPERSLAQAESVTLAFMVLLETLSPEERAVFLLREVFDYEYDEIAVMLETTSVSCSIGPSCASPSGSRDSARRSTKSGRWSSDSCAPSARAARRS
jgi:RNA polymerase sigma-70 factor (ECF subfamily)